MSNIGWYIERYVEAHDITSKRSAGWKQAAESKPQLLIGLEREIALEVERRITKRLEELNLIPVDEVYS